MNIPDFASSCEPGKADDRLGASCFAHRKNLARKNRSIYCTRHGPEIIIDSWFSGGGSFYSPSLSCAPVGRPYFGRGM
jgi:hypothetical protein